MVGIEIVQRSHEHPNFPGLRRRVVADLHREIGEVLRPLRYARRGRCWVRRSLLAVSYLEVQRDRYGFGCFINVGRDAPGRPVPSYRDGTHWRIDSYPRDRLPYIDLEPGSALRQEVRQTLQEQVVPFLLSCHGLRSLRFKPPSLRWHGGKAKSPDVEREATHP